jgi:hypothetical protein
MLPVFGFVGDRNLDEQAVGEDKYQNDHHIEDQLEGMIGKIPETFTFLVGGLGLHKKDTANRGNDADQDKGRDGKAPSPEIAQHDPEKLENNDDKKHVVDELEDRISLQVGKPEGGVNKNDNRTGHEKDRDNKVNEVVDPEKYFSKFLDEFEMGVGRRGFRGTGFIQGVAPLSGSS